MANIQNTRIQFLNRYQTMAGNFGLYWMQQAQRSHCNHALEYAIEQANRLECPLVTLFVLSCDYPEANARHYEFLLQGLRDVAKDLEKRKIGFAIRTGNPPGEVSKFARHAAFVVTDTGYTRIQRQWRRTLSNILDIPVIQVETDAIIPVTVTSDHEQYAARTIRPRIHKHLPDYLIPIQTVQLEKPSVNWTNYEIDIENTEQVMQSLKVNKSVGPSPLFSGGQHTARKLLRSFIRHKLPYYNEQRNKPSLDYVSHMSPYLHFGHISPLEIALAIKDADAPDQDRNAYLEELIVRRELSMNFVYYNNAYDQYKGLPEWARLTLDKHRKDIRKYVYSLKDLEQANTHDHYWNAAQRQMLEQGKMHNYMRMYWGKKIIEWSYTPEEAFAAALYLNNKYELDGRDPNSFTGIAWCFGKHDRPWTERPIFGKIRYMNANGLNRKFNMKPYVDHWTTH